MSAQKHMQILQLGSASMENEASETPHPVFLVPNKNNALSNFVTAETIKAIKRITEPEEKEKLPELQVLITSELQKFSPSSETGVPKKVIVLPESYVNTVNKEVESVKQEPLDNSANIKPDNTLAHPKSNKTSADIPDYGRMITIAGDDKIVQGYDKILQGYDQTKRADGVLLITKKGENVTDEGEIRSSTASTTTTNTQSTLDVPIYVDPVSGKVLLLPEKFAKSDQNDLSNVPMYLDPVSGKVLLLPEKSAKSDQNNLSSIKSLSSASTHNLSSIKSLSSASTHNLSSIKSLSSASTQTVPRMIGVPVRIRSPLVLNTLPGGTNFAKSAPGAVILNVHMPGLGTPPHTVNKAKTTATGSASIVVSPTTTSIPSTFVPNSSMAAGASSLPSGQMPPCSVPQKTSAIPICTVTTSLITAGLVPSSSICHGPIPNPMVLGSKPSLTVPFSAIPSSLTHLGLKPSPIVSSSSPGIVTLSLSKPSMMPANVVCNPIRKTFLEQTAFMTPKSSFVAFGHGSQSVSAVPKVITLPTKMISIPTTLNTSDKMPTIRNNPITLPAHTSSQDVTSVMSNTFVSNSTMATSGTSVNMSVGAPVKMSAPWLSTMKAFLYSQRTGTTPTTSYRYIGPGPSMVIVPGSKAAVSIYCDTSLRPQSNTVTCSLSSANKSIPQVVYSTNMVQSVKSTIVSSRPSLEQIGMGCSIGTVATEINPLRDHQVVLSDACISLSTKQPGVLSGRYHVSTSVSETNRLVTTPVLANKPVSTQVSERSLVSTPVTTICPVATPVSANKLVSTQVSERSLVFTPVTTICPVATPISANKHVSTQVSARSLVSTPVTTICPVATPVSANKHVTSPVSERSLVSTPVTTICPVTTPVSANKHVASPVSDSRLPDFSTSLSTASRGPKPVLANSPVSTSKVAVNQASTQASDVKVYFDAKQALKTVIKNTASSTVTPQNTMATVCIANYTRMTIGSQQYLIPNSLIANTKSTQSFSSPTMCSSISELSCKLSARMNAIKDGNAGSAEKCVPVTTAQSTKSGSVPTVVVVGPETYSSLPPKQSVPLTDKSKVHAIPGVKERAILPYCPYRMVNAGSTHSTGFTVPSVETSRYPRCIAPSNTKHTVKSEAINAPSAAGYRIQKNGTSQASAVQSTHSESSCATIRKSVKSKNDSTTPSKQNKPHVADATKDTQAIVVKSKRWTFESSSSTDTNPKVVIGKDLKEVMAKYKPCRVVINRLPLKRTNKRMWFPEKVAQKMAAVTSCSLKCKQSYIKRLFRHGDPLAPELLWTDMHVGKTADLQNVSSTKSTISSSGLPLASNNRVNVQVSSSGSKVSSSVAPTVSHGGLHIGSNNGNVVSSCGRRVSSSVAPTVSHGGLHIGSNNDTVQVSSSGSKVSSSVAPTVPYSGLHIGSNNGNVQVSSSGSKVSSSVAPTVPYSGLHLGSHNVNVQVSSCGRKVSSSVAPTVSHGGLHIGSNNGNVQVSSCGRRVSSIVTPTVPYSGLHLGSNNVNIQVSSCGRKVSNFVTSTPTTVSSGGLHLGSNGGMNVRVSSSGCEVSSSVVTASTRSSVVRTAVINVPIPSSIPAKNVPTSAISVQTNVSKSLGKDSAVCRITIGNKAFYLPVSIANFNAYVGNKNQTGVTSTTNSVGLSMAPVATMQINKTSKTTSNSLDALQSVTVKAEPKTHGYGDESTEFSSSVQVKEEPTNRGYSDEVEVQLGKEPSESGGNSRKRKLHDANERNVEAKKQKKDISQQAEEKAENEQAVNESKNELFPKEITSAADKIRRLKEKMKADLEKLEVLRKGLKKDYRSEFCL